jgi:hypothetical protein
MSVDQRDWRSFSFAILLLQALPPVYRFCFDLLLLLRGMLLLLDQKATHVLNPNERDADQCTAVRWRWALEIHATSNALLTYIYEGLSSCRWSGWLRGSSLTLMTAALETAA